MTKNKGFSLVELMMTISVMGIIAIVGIPKYMAYKNKAKTAEAKIILSAIYTAQQNLKNQYDSYGTCLEMGGFAGPSISSDRFYAAGFPAHNAITNNNIVNNGGSGCDNTTTNAIEATKGFKGQIATAADLVASTNNNSLATTGVANDGNSYTASAVGFIGESIGNSQNNSSKDHWAIDENKGLIRYTNP